MKRRVIGLLAACSLAAFVSSAVAQQQAYSANAIGVIKKTIPGNGSAFISIPLDNPNGEMKFSDTPLMSLPTSSQVSIYDPVEAVWVTGTKVAPNRGGWGSFSNRVISIYEPMFVQNAGSSDFVAIFSGNVPEEDSIDVHFYGASLQSFANPYPTPLVWSNSVVAANCKVSSKAYIWDGSQWIEGIKMAANRGGWNSFASRVIGPGEGVFFQEAGSSDWTWEAEKPYVWPEEPETNN
jgi:hypothetical protein